jgi:hypothetical protein
MALALGGARAPDAFPWGRVPRLLRAYEAAAGGPLTGAERGALPAYAAAVPLFQATVAGFTRDPVGALRDDVRRPFLRLAGWLLAHPEAVLG